MASGFNTNKEQIWIQNPFALFMSISILPSHEMSFEARCNTITRLVLLLTLILWLIGFRYWYVFLIAGLFMVILLYLMHRPSIVDSAQVGLIIKDGINDNKTINDININVKNTDQSKKTANINIIDDTNTNNNGNNGNNGNKKANNGLKEFFVCTSIDDDDDEKDPVVNSQKYIHSDIKEKEKEADPVACSQKYILSSNIIQSSNLIIDPSRQPKPETATTKEKPRSDALIVNPSMSWGSRKIHPFVRR
jgi:hypothetical protein